MRKLILALLITATCTVFIKSAQADTTPLAWGVSADSANSPSTVVYRDTSGNFTAGTITATIVNASSAAVTNGITATAVTTSSSTTSGFMLSIDGAFTTVQLQAKTPARAGQLVYNSTLVNVCVSTGTTIQGYKLVGTTSTGCN